MANVTIYTTPTCVYCNMAKQFFKENNIAYVEKDVAQDSKAADEAIEKSGQMAVPVIVVENEGKEEVIVGFDKEKLAMLLPK